MIITMIAMGMMKMAIHQIINVVAVGNSLVAAARTMDMASVVAGTLMVWGANIGVRVGNGNHMLVNMVHMGVMKVAIMKIINMPLMKDSGMATARTVDMGVIVVSGASGHERNL
jgi:hypothetical protein